MAMGSRYNQENPLARYTFTGYVAAMDGEQIRDGAEWRADNDNNCFFCHDAQRREITIPKSDL